MVKKSIEELAAEARRNYHKQWRKKNKDKIKSYNASYWEKCVQKIETGTVREKTEDADS